MRLSVINEQRRNQTVLKKNDTTLFSTKTTLHIYLTIIPRTHVGYKLLDSGRGAKQRVSYHNFIANKREWNNCFIKYQTLDTVYLEFQFLPTPVFGHFKVKLLR